MSPSTRNKGKKDSAKKATSNPSDKPKRPLSAYNIFFQHERENMLKSRPAKTAGKNNKKQTEKDVASAAAADDDDDDDDGYDHSRHSTIHNSPSARRDRSKKARPPPHRKVGFAEMARMIGKKWKELDDQHRRHFQSLAAIDKNRYIKEMARYKARMNNPEAKHKEETAKDEEEGDVCRHDKHMKTHKECVHNAPVQHAAAAYNNTNVPSAARDEETVTTAAAFPTASTQTSHPYMHQSSHHYAHQPIHDNIDEGCGLAEVQSLASYQYYEPQSFTIGDGWGQQAAPHPNNYMYPPSAHHQQHCDFLPPPAKDIRSHPRTASVAQEDTAQYAHPQPQHPYTYGHRHGECTNVPIMPSSELSEPSIAKGDCSRPTIHHPAEASPMPYDISPLKYTTNNDPTSSATKKTSGSGDTCAPTWEDFDSADQLLEKKNDPACSATEKTSGSGDTCAPTWEDFDAAGQLLGSPGSFDANK